MNFTIIKSKSFDCKGTTQTHFTVAYKGRVLSVSTFNFEADQLKVNGNALTISTDIEVRIRTEKDLLGSTKTYLDVMPKFGLDIAVC